MPMDNVSLIKQAAESIKTADGLLITSGAGMGVDSGLPDFRGNSGFWKAYPALASQDMSFTDIASPDNFKDNPKLAWGFYGHRLNLYRSTKPHDGYIYLRAIGEQLPLGYFVFTSNVDGHYQKSGCLSDKIIECHGSIHHLQCINDCKGDIWSAKDFNIEVDENNCIALSKLPTCPHCGEITRPNILMFGDAFWNGERTQEQHKRYEKWLNTVEDPVIIECGAGTSISTVRQQGEYQKGTLIRINPREPESNKPSAFCIKANAIDAIRQINYFFQQTF